MDNIGALIVPAVIALVAISIVAKGVRVVQQAQTIDHRAAGEVPPHAGLGVNSDHPDHRQAARDRLAPGVVTPAVSRSRGISARRRSTCARRCTCSRVRT